MYKMTPADFDRARSSLPGGFPRTRSCAQNDSKSRQLQVVLAFAIIRPGPGNSHVTTGALNELPLLVTPYHRLTGEKQARALSNHRFAAGCRTHERQFHGGMSLVTSIREMMKQDIGTSYSAHSELSVGERFIPCRR